MKEMLGQRCTFLPLPVPIHEARLLTTGAFRLFSQEEGRIQEHRVSRNPYPFEGRSQANEGDDARTKRALAEIGVGAMPRDERSKRRSPKCFSSFEMPLDRAGCVTPLARGCAERTRLGDCPGIPQALDAQAFGHNPTS